ncbi:hypothetical protein [Methyloligella solikamskensis]|uniref:Uncharacterized protein n=1 Tax=Methyloligella solikamskensis TaxID=1177756 RepID=A0ABW3JB59_9HYPH
MKRAVRRCPKFESQWLRYAAASTVGLKAMAVIDSHLSYMSQFDDAISRLMELGILFKVKNSAGVYELRPRNISYYVKLSVREDIVAATEICVENLAEDEIEGNEVGASMDAGNKVVKKRRNP